MIRQFPLYWEAERKTIIKSVVFDKQGHESAQKMGSSLSEPSKSECPERLSFWRKELAALAFVRNPSPSFSSSDAVAGSSWLAWKERNLRLPFSQTRTMDFLFVLSRRLLFLFYPVFIREAAKNSGRILKQYVDIGKDWFWHILLTTFWLIFCFIKTLD